MPGRRLAAVGIEERLGVRRTHLGNVRNAGSMMLWVLVALLRTRVHSVLLKKNSLFLTIGPPIE